MYQEDSAPDGAAMRGLVGSARRQSLGDLPRRAAARYPDKEAIIDGPARLTFAEFDAQVDRAAAALHAAGLRQGDRLMLLSHNCWQFPVLIFAAARRGLIAVPVNYMLGAAEIAYLIEHSGAAAVVAEDALAATADAALAQAAPAAPLKIAIRFDMEGPPDGWTSFDAWMAPHYPLPPGVDIADDDPVRIMYTSGTESRPKGVLLSSRSLLWQYTSCIVTGGMESSDREVHALPLYHCAQLDNFLSTDIFLGASSVILRRPDPEQILRTIERERISNLFCPPTIWTALLQSPAFDATDLSTLRKAYYGASAMPVEVLNTLQARLPGIRFWNFYGQTEMASLATALAPEDQRLYPGSAGLPALNVETRIVDAQDRPAPAGEIGEIVHRSPHAALGYYRDPAKTAEAFRGGWFHSGDLGYFAPSGHLYVVDRIKDMIKTGGENVASREVEEVLYGHPQVSEAAVFGVDHPDWIEMVVAVVVARPGQDLDPQEVMRHCRARLAGYKTPKHVIVADELPKTASGKILKRELRRLHADAGQAPALGRPATA
ncbi:fatty acyl-CoA synthetase [Achromobacter aegrifaciens]